MSLFRAVIGLLLGLTLEAALGRWAPQARAYVDVMLVPVAWYGIARSQRSAMVVGCAAGLLQDAWFQVGVFGINGFKKTLLGFLLGGLGGTLDLNQTWGRFVSGAALAVADRVLEFALRWMMDQARVPLDPVELGIRAGVGGLLVGTVFAILNRVRGKDVVHRRDA